MNNLPDKKYPTVVKTCFSGGKWMKQLGNPRLSKRNPLSTNPPISKKFFMTPLFVQIWKTRNTPIVLGEGRKLWCCFSNTLRQLLLKLPRNNRSLLIQLQVAEHKHISHRFFSNFSCVLSSVLFSPHFCRYQVKMLFNIH